MTGELRAKVIRLAHTRPDLRPHLLPLLAARKVAYARIPDGFVSFGYKGVGAETAGLQMANEVKGVIREMKDQARSTWKSLAAELMSNSDVDAQPALSRAAVRLAITDTYHELIDKADIYFKALP